MRATLYQTVAWLAALLLAAATIAGLCGLSLGAPAPLSRRTRDVPPWPVGEWRGHCNGGSQSVRITFAPEGGYEEWINENVQYLGVWRYDSRWEVTVAVPYFASQNRHDWNVPGFRQHFRREGSLTVLYAGWPGCGPFRRVR